MMINSIGNALLLLAFGSCLELADGREGNKPYILNVLHIMPLTGNAPRTAYECRAASEVVINLINKRADILPDYHLQIVVDDEFTNGIRSVANTFKFVRRFEELNAKAVVGKQTDNFVSPAMVTGFFTNGCKSLGAILHHINMIAFSIQCSSKVLTQRQYFPNFYLTRATAVENAHAQVHFMKRLAGWNKIAILGYLANVNDNANAQYFYGIAVKNNMSVVWYDSVADIDLDDSSIADSLKKSDARIISYWGGAFILLKLLCLTLKFGITGSRYVFIAYTSVITEPAQLAETLYPGCTRRMVAEQYKYTLGFDQPQLPLTKTIRSSFGYDADGFDEMFDRYTNSSRGFDYSTRFKCQDATMDVIITLDQAEKAMKQSGTNLTLRSYQQYPKEVAKFVNDSAIKLDFNGLRIGRIKYSMTGELATDPVSVAYIDAAGTLQYACIINQLENTYGDNINDWKIQLLMNKFPWVTPDAQPPRDGSSFHRTIYTVPTSFLVSVAVLSGLSTFGTIIGFIRLIRKVPSDHDERITKSIFATGCCVLNIAAVLFSIDNNAVLWHFRVGCLVIGLSLVNGTFFSRIRSYKVESIKIIPKFGFTTRGTASVSHHVNSYQSNSRRQSQIKLSSIRSSVHSNTTAMTRSTTTNSTAQVSMKPVLLKASMSKQDYVVLIAFIAINTLLVIIWLGLFPFSCLEKAESPIYDNSTDSYQQLVKTECVSENQQYWQFAFAAFHLLLLAVAGFYVYFLHSHRGRIVIPDLTLMTAGVVNSAVTLVASVLILLILDDQTDQIPAVAIICVVFSSITTLTTVYSSKQTTTTTIGPEVSMHA